MRSHRMQRIVWLACAWGAAAAGCQYAGVFTPLLRVHHDPVPETAAENPLLHGESLVAIQQPEDSELKGLLSPDCDRWPIPKERYELHVDSAQLCAALTMVLAKQPIGMTDMSLVVATDRGSATLAANATGPARKIASCIKRYDGGTPAPKPVDVWAVDFTGCTANTQAVTAESSWLALRMKEPQGLYDRARWRFKM